MNGYLLDTNICVFLLRGKGGVRERISQQSSADCYISEVTIAELKFGAYKSNRPTENLWLIDRMAEAFRVVPFAESIDIFAKEKVRLCKQGTPIEDFDLLIASAALAKGLTFVTDNLKHFVNLSDLHIENWVKR